MRRLAVLGVVLAGVASTTPSAAERVAARIGVEEIRCEDLHAAETRTCAAELLREIRDRAEQRFVATQGLQATADEIEAVRAHERAFARHDRAQRAQKLEELEARLVHMGAQMSAAEHERLVEFRAVLRRLAAYEADVARGALAPPELSTATMAHWIEQAKLDAALYRRYGGSVGLKAAGPYAHSARAELVADYMRHENIEVPDPEVERHLLVALWAPPSIVYRGATPDFTPFWMRALVPSYVGP
ncbi:MAG: hypothetical protein ACREUX_19655 [Burkholderiales bacterium]